jgi:hypothetical protein
MPQIDLKKTSEILKNRIRVCKKRLPNNWRQLIIILAPEYDSLKGARLMDNVFKLRSSDLRLTELIEQIAANSMVEDSETAIEKESNVTDTIK